MNGTIMRKNWIIDYVSNKHTKNKVINLTEINMIQNV